MNGVCEITCENDSNLRSLNGPCLDRQAEWAEFERMEAIDTKNAALEKAAEEQRSASAASTPEPSQDGDSDTQYVYVQVMLPPLTDP
jgi:hypothetical protein